MIIDRIKISQEINFNGMPTWIGLEGTLLPGEDEITGLRTLQKSITDYQTEEEKKYRESKIYQVKVPDKIQGWFEVIKLASSIKALEKFKPQVDRENNEDLTSAYDNKLKSLQNV